MGVIEYLNSMEAGIQLVKFLTVQGIRDRLDLIRNHQLLRGSSLKIASSFPSDNLNNTNGFQYIFLDSLSIIKRLH